MNDRVAFAGIDLTGESRRVFRFLLHSDWQLLFEIARLVSFSTGDEIIHEGLPAAGLYIIKNGGVRVEQTYKEKRIVIAQRGAGELLGEVSFLEGASAMASVVAKEDTSLYLIETAQLNSLIASVPGFPVRLYKSLSVYLTERLREAAASFVYVKEHAETAFAPSDLEWIQHRIDELAI